MLRNEYRKICNWKVLLVLLVIGITFFYCEPMSQMNLEHLPLFEAVEVAVGTELRERYGKELDSSEIEEIKLIAQEKSEELNRKVMETFGDRIGDNFDSYEEFEKYMWNVDPEELVSGELEKLEDLQWEIYETFLWEVEEVSYYYEGIINAYEWSEDKENYMISVVPPQVVSNMRFVMGDFAGWVLILVILLVLPYLAGDNRAGVYPIIATTKTGRKLLLKQIAVMLSSVAVLLIICDIVFVAVLHRMTPYDSFYDCIAINAIYDWTLTQLYTAQILIINVAAISVAMIVFVLSSLCGTIVSIVAVAILCWFMTTMLSDYFLAKSFLTLDAGRDFWMNVQAAALSAPVQVCIVFLAIGIGLLMLLYRHKKREDIFG